MANAEVPTSSPEPQHSKRPPDTVIPPPPPTPPVDIESHNDSASDGQEEHMEEDCDMARSESENKIPLPTGSDFLSEGKAFSCEDSSFGKGLVGEEPMLDSHATKLETIQEEKELPAVKLDTSTPEQPMGECQVVKSGSERKRKSHDGSINMESLVERTDRRLTRSNSRIISKGTNECQKVAKRLTRSQKPSPADYLGNDVDILGLERALKRLSKTGSKRVLQEPTGDDHPPSTSHEKTSDCIMSDLLDSDGSSDAINRGITIIEEIMETIEEDQTQPICVEVPTKDLVNLDCLSTEADENFYEIKETNEVCAKEESVFLSELVSDEPMSENKVEEQTAVLPIEVCSTAVEVSSDENKLENSRLETPSKRLTRSALKNEQLNVSGISGLGSSMDGPILKSENVEEQETIVSDELNPVSIDRSTDVVKIEKPGLDVPSKRLTRSALKNAQMDVTPFLGFRSTIDEPRPETQNAKKIEVTQVSIDGSSDSNTIKLENPEFETPLRRITRSAVKHAQIVSSELESPPRRFTRSLLKCDVSYDEEDGTGDNGDVSELERSTRKVSSSSQKGNKSYSRPMMSGGCKKFDLIKPPSNARELLASGYLEGLDVMYIIPHSKKPVLKGVIKGGNILCFCSACKGLRSVSAYNFEVHAGSTKKHPSDFIFLENGNTLRDVLRVCSSARINDLEAALKNEVSPISKKNLRACLKCGSLLTSDVHNFFLCDSCSATNQLLPPCDSTLNINQSPVTTQRSSIPVLSQSSLEILSKSVSSPTSSLPSSTKKTNTVGRLTRKFVPPSI
ncbi:hypothetical protein FCM35_KLT13126 [Carex littledalei]|uniref:Tify domain-containing protein n=1 Tax=Carex littledalei TaxID=544730 RepID=A0A833QJT5_9POAL|nr:hypothetical protein FCM35_KLT13126 [Carex littledalei]